MYLYLFRSYIQSAGIVTPIRESCLGELSTVIKQLKTNHAVRTVGKHTETPFIGICVDNHYYTKEPTVHLSYTVTNWISKLSVFDGVEDLDPIALDSFCTKDCIYNLVLVNKQEHTRLARRSYSMPANFKQKSSRFITLSVESKKPKESIYLVKVDKQLASASDIEEFLNKTTKHLSIDHCVRQFILKHHATGFKNLETLKTFEEDSVKIVINNTRSGVVLQEAIK